MPVESSLLGTIRENLDLLWAFELPIVGEVSVPVRLALLGLPGETLDGDRARVLDRRGARPGGRVPAVAPVERADDLQHGGRREGDRRAPRARRGRRRVGAGSPGSTASRCWPTTSRRQRQPHPVRGDRAARRGGAGHRGRATGRGRRPAADDAGLRGAQRARARSTARSGPSRARGLNLSRLESRPWTARGSRWEYLFWVDLDADPADPECAAALAELGTETEVVRILGTYARAAED